MARTKKPRRVIFSYDDTGDWFVVILATIFAGARCVTVQMTRSGRDITATAWPAAPEAAPVELCMDLTELAP